MNENIDPVVMWQLEKIEAELRLLVGHAVDATCPCDLDLTSCLRKHALLIGAYTMETMPMVSGELSDFLEELSGEACEMKDDIVKAVCGEDDTDDEDRDLELSRVATWGRDWAKRIESKYTCPKSKE